MLWIAGMVLALAGGLINFFGVWMNKKDRDKSQLPVFFSMGFTGFIYALLLYILLYDFPSYADYTVLMMGVATVGVNLGRAYVAPEILGELAENKKVYSKTIIVYGSMFETFIIFTLLIGVLIYMLLMNGEIPLDVVKNSMLSISASSFVGAIIMAMFIKRGYTEGAKLQNDFQKFMLWTIPGNAIVVIGLLISIMLLTPYMPQ